jgi:D-3-phosphoglycerate dehydrogenase
VRIAVLDDYADHFRHTAAAARLDGHEVVAFTDTVRGADLAARLDGFDAVLLLQQRTALPREVVVRLTTLRFISQTGRSTAHLDLEALAERGVTISAQAAPSSRETAELTCALVLASSRHLPEEVAALRAGRWQSTVGVGLHGATLGVYGLGRIGSHVARVGAAFGMEVLVWGRSGSLDRAVEQGYAAAVSREAFFAECDVLCLHVPLTDETRSVVTAADLALMKPTALFVNTSRSGLVEPGALAAAVRAGRPGRVAVDVFDDEPVTAGSDPLVGLPGVTATPHLGYVTTGSLDRLYELAVDQLLAFAAGAPVDVVT